MNREPHSMSWWFDYNAILEDSSSYDNPLWPANTHPSECITTACSIPPAENQEDSAKHRLQSLVETSAERWNYAIFSQLTDSHDGGPALARGDACSIASPDFSVGSNTPAENQEDFLQQRLQSLVETSAERWTYAIFWQLTDSHDGEPALAWGDGFFNPKELNSPNLPLCEAIQQLRRKILREMLEFFTQSTDDASMLDSFDGEVPDTEWFYLVSMLHSFAIGNDAPGIAFKSSQHAWLKGVDQRISGRNCARAELAQRFGIQTIVCVPTQNGVLELGSTHVIEQNFGFLNIIKQSFDPLFSSMGIEFLASPVGFADANHGMGVLEMGYMNNSANEMSVGDSGQSQNKWASSVSATILMQDWQAAAVVKRARQGLNDGMHGDPWHTLLPQYSPLDMMFTGSESEKLLRMGWQQAGILHTEMPSSTENGLGTQIHDFHSLGKASGKNITHQSSDLFQYELPYPRTLKDDSQLSASEGIDHHRFKGTVATTENLRDVMKPLAAQKSGETWGMPQTFATPANLCELTQLAVSSASQMHLSETVKASHSPVGTMGAPQIYAHCERSMEAESQIKANTTEKNLPSVQELIQSVKASEANSYMDGAEKQKL